MSHPREPGVDQIEAHHLVWPGDGFSWEVPFGTRRERPWDKSCAELLRGENEWVKVAITLHRENPKFNVLEAEIGQKEVEIPDWI